MRKKAILILLIAWVVTIATGIFLFSSQTGEESGEISKGLMDNIFTFLQPDAEGEEKLHHLIRKGAHMTEYAVLGASVCALFFYLADIKHGKSVSRFGMMGYAWIFSVLFAVTDEIHQAFVPGRGPSVKDVLIDSVGAAIGIALIYLIRRYKKRKTRETNR